MHIVEMKEDFTCDVNNGVFRFGDIVIDTLHLDDDGFGRHFKMAMMICICNEKLSRTRNADRLERLVRRSY